jgi:hypothetical protein
MLIAVRGQTRDRRCTQVNTLLILLSSEGGNQSSPDERRFLLIVCPRWDSSAAKTTWRVASFVIAMPVVFEPGSSLTRKGSDLCTRTAYFKMIVKG